MRVVSSGQKHSHGGRDANVSLDMGGDKSGRARCGPHGVGGRIGRMTARGHDADAADAVRTLADEYWETFLETDPLLASRLGDHRYDDRAIKLSADAERARRGRWVQLRERLAAIDPDQLDTTDRDTLELLSWELDTAIRWIDMRLSELAWDQMQGAHTELLATAAQLRAPDVDTAFRALVRIDAMATMLDEAAQRFREGLRAGRTPAAVSVTRSHNQIDSYLASPLDSDPFVSIAGPDENWGDEERWRADMAAAVRDRLRPAFARYQEAYTTELGPAARPDDKPGLVYMAGGDKLYQELIHHNTGLVLSADELHQVGLEQATGSLREEFAEVGLRALGTSDVADIFDRLRNDTGLRYGSADELLEHSRQCLQNAGDVMPDWFGVLPTAACELAPVPDYLAADVPPAYYEPPAPDGSRPGRYRVNLHHASERGRFQSASVTYHEGIPGHHLQLAIAMERSDLPAFRRFSLLHNAYIEGWGLYAERLADEMGLYDDLGRLGMLASDAFRAARLVVDTGLHARGWTRQQAVDFMVEYVPLPVETIAVEVDRYIGLPAQALSYKVGQRDIFAQRARAEAALGTRFDIKGFHDAVLDGGTISLPVLRRRIAAWVAGS